MSQKTKEELQSLIEKATAGEKEALETLVTGIQDMVFNLSLRMLGTFPDAEDAAQDIFQRGERLCHMGLPHCRESPEELQETYVRTASAEFRILWGRHREREDTGCAGHDPGRGEIGSGGRAEAVLYQCDAAVP